MESKTYEDGYYKGFLDGFEACQEYYAYLFKPEEPHFDFKTDYWKKNSYTPDCIHPIKSIVYEIDKEQKDE